MGELKGSAQGDGLARTPRDPPRGRDGRAQPGPLDRPGTEAEQRANRPGLDKGTTEGLSKTS